MATLLLYDREIMSSNSKISLSASKSKASIDLSSSDLIQWEHLILVPLN